MWISTLALSCVPWAYQPPCLPSCLRCATPSLLPFGHGGSKHLLVQHDCFTAGYVSSHSSQMRTDARTWLYLAEISLYLAGGRLRELWDGWHSGRRWLRSPCHASLGLGRSVVSIVCLAMFLPSVHQCKKQLHTHCKCCSTDAMAP